jgi:hypothetical protein
LLFVIFCSCQIRNKIAGEDADSRQK